MRQDTLSGLEFSDCREKVILENNKDILEYHKCEILDILNSYGSLATFRCGHSITDYYILGDKIRKLMPDMFSEQRQKEVVYNYLKIAKILENKNITDLATNIATMYNNDNKQFVYIAICNGCVDPIVMVAGSEIILIDKLDKYYDIFEKVSYHKYEQPMNGSITNFIGTIVYEDDVDGILEISIYEKEVLKCI